MAMIEQAQTKELPAGVYRRPGTTRLWIRYGVKGRLIRESAKTPDPKKAERLRFKRIAEAEAGLRVGPQQDRLTVAALLDAYMANRRLAGKRGLAHINLRCRKLKAEFGWLRANEITLPRLEKWATEKITAGVARGTVKIDLAYLRAAFNVAARLGLTTHRPHWPTIELDNARQGFFEQDQVDALRAAIAKTKNGRGQLHGPMLADVVTFMHRSGWRIQEILDLPWSEVDRERGEIRLSAARSKTRKARVLPIVGELEDVIERRWKARVVRSSICPWVFHRAGKPVKNIYVAWRAACRAAGIAGRTPHDFRRTCARDLINAGVPEKVAMSITGHQSRQLFDRYHIVTSDDQRKALEQAQAVRPAKSNVVALRRPQQ